MTNRRPHDLSAERTSPCVAGAGLLAVAASCGTGGRLALAGRPGYAGQAVAARWQDVQGPMTVATFEGFCLLSLKDISREVLPT
jgi:hypothetical protein